MSEQRIERMRKKFILASTLSFFSVMLLMGGLIYLFITLTERNEVRQIMEYIVENDGDLPEPTLNPDDQGQTVSEENSKNSASDTEDTGLSDSGSDLGRDENEEMAWSLQHFFGTGNVIVGSQDFAGRTRYFAVLFDEEDCVEEVKSRHMEDVDTEEAERYARIARKRFLRMGSFDTFYYYVAERENGGTIVVYLDRTSQIFTAYRVFYFTLILLGTGSLIAFAIMRLISHRMVRSEVDNIELQKQFITNASHELKTPLAVIRANTEMQEMLEGETEWTQSTMRQVSRMEGLIKNLVMIARAQELNSGETLQKLGLSGIVKDTAESFGSVASSEQKKLTVDVQEELYIQGDESGIRQLVSLLTDNAVKYCDAEGEIHVILKKQGKNALLTISNSFSSDKPVDTSRFFERFYREDSSHNEKGGYGIGLSVAESLTRQMRGKLQAEWKEQRIFFHCRFPLINA